MNLKKNIYLSGFMGTGKTVVGREVARLLSVPFVDTDSLIESKVGQSVEKIFAKKGEPYFRQLETITLRGLAGDLPRVVSVGGGVVLNPANREILRYGVWVNLQASPAIIFRRVSLSKKRPLLGKRIKLETIESLLSKRRPCYDLAPHQVDTTFLGVDAAAQIVIRVVQSQTP